MRAPPTETQVAEALGYLCDNFGKDPVREARRVRVWCDALKRTDGSLLMDAARALCRDCEYFPPVSKLLAVVHRLETATTVQSAHRADVSETCNLCHATEWYDKPFVRNGEAVLDGNGKQLMRVMPRHYPHCRLKTEDQPVDMPRPRNPLRIMAEHTP